MSQGLFIPTILADQVETTDENLWVFLLACRYVLHSYFKSSFKSVGKVCLVFILLIGIGLIGSPGRPQIATLTDLIALLFAGSVIGLVIWTLYHVPTMHSYTKVYLNLEQKTVNQGQTLLHCAWAPSDRIELIDAHTNQLTDLIQSLSGCINPIAGEANLLQTLDQIAQIATNPRTETIDVPFLSRLPITEKGIHAASKFAIPLTRAHSKYVSYYTPPIGHARTNDPSQLLDLRQQLRNDIEVIRRAKAHIEEQTQLALRAVVELPITTIAFPDAGYFPLAESAQQLNGVNLPQRLDALLSETLRSLKDQIQPEIDHIERTHALRLQQTKEIYDERCERAQEKRDEQFRHFDQLINQLDESIEERQSEIEVLQQASKAESIELSHKERELQETPPTISTPVISTDSLAQSQIYAFSVNPQHMRIVEKVQELKVHVSAQDRQIRAYAQEVQHKGLNRKNYLEQRKKVEDDFKQKTDKYLDIYRTTCQQLETSKQSEINRMEKPIAQLCDVRQRLVPTAKRFQDVWQVPVDPALARYSCTSKQILDFRQRVITALTTNTLQKLDVLQSRLEQAAATIDSYLWPTQTLPSFDRLSIPIWLVYYQKDRAKDHLIPLSLFQFSASLPNDSGGTRTIDPIAPVMQWVYSLVNFQAPHIKQNLSSHISLADLTYVQQLQRAVSTKYATKEIDLFSMLIAQLELFRRRLRIRKP